MVPVEQVDLCGMFILFWTHACWLIIHEQDFITEYFGKDGMTIIQHMDPPTDRKSVV